MDKARYVLLIAYYWPPSTEVAVVRVEKLARHLTKLGWKPIILTVNPWHYEHISRSESEETFSVLRTPAFISPLKGYATVKMMIQRLRRRSRVFSEGHGSYGEPHNESFVATARRLCLSLLFTPDEFQGWLPFAIYRAISSIKKYNIRNVITSGPPFTSHLVGLAVKKWQGTHINWVADFRDPWVACEQRPALITSAMSDHVNLFLEKHVTLNADHIVCVTPSMTEEYRKRYPLVSDAVWETITNGFELSEFESIRPIMPSAKFTISYVGSIEYERSPECLFRAVTELCKEGAFEKRSISIRLIGKCDLMQGRQTREVIRTHDLDGVVELVGTVTRSDALQEMINAHVLLLLANGQRLQVPGKAYEYIGARRFILAITENHGATADLIRRIGCGAVLHPSDHRSIKRVLKDCYEEFVRQDLNRSNDFPADSLAILREYEWHALGRQYETLLD